MAQKPDGKPARTERVTFTKPAAERIAKVVRAVEGGDRDAGPLTFGTRSSPAKSVTFSLARYPSTNSWTKGSTAQVLIVTANTSTVAFSGVTASAWNQFALISGHTGSTSNTTLGVIIMMTKISGDWWVVNAEA
jgi:hypothetical protein